MTPSSASPAIFLLVCFAACFSCPARGDARGHIFSVVGVNSSEGLFAPALRVQGGAAGAQSVRVLGGLRAFFERAHANVAARNSTAVGTACNRITGDWSRSVKAELEAMGIGDVTQRCQTSIFHAGAEARGAEALLRDAAGVFLAAGGGHPALAGWGAPTALRDWRFRNREQRCVFQRAAGIAVRGQWFARAALTDAPVQATLGAGRRRVVHEYVATRPGAPSLAISVAGKPGFRAALERVRGPAPASAFYDVAPADTLAMEAALRRNADALGQARDATTPSNMAIIFIPLVMVFVPVALVAHADGRWAFCYIFVTDVLSTVPVLVKGAELLRTGTARNREAASLFLGEGQLKVIETWVAVCSGREALRNQGLVFLSIGIFCLCTGLFLEVVAQRYVGDRMRAGAQTSTLGNLLLVPAAPDTMPEPLEYVQPENNIRVNFSADLPNVPRRAALFAPFADAASRLRARNPR